MCAFLGDVEMENVHTDAQTDEGIKRPEEDQIDVVSRPRTNSHRTLVTFGDRGGLRTDPTARTTKSILSIGTTDGQSVFTSVKGL